MNPEELKRKIRRQNKFIAVAGIVLLAGIFVFFGVIDRRTRSGDEVKEVKAFILADQKIRLSYGMVSSADLDNYEISKSMVDGSKNGCFRFKIKGELRSGLHRICWEKKGRSHLRILSQDSVETEDMEKVIRDIKTLFSGR
jgi:hypothetical protein